MPRHIPSTSYNSDATEDRRVVGPRFSCFVNHPNLFQIFSDMVCVCQNGTIEYLNEAGVNILGAKAVEELIGRHLADFIPDHDAAHTDVFCAALAEKNTSTSFVLRTLDDTDIRVNIRVHHAREIHPEAFVLIAENVNDRLSLSEAARRSEERYSHLVANALDLICVSEANRITYINTAGLKMLGATDETQIIGRPVSAFTQRDYREIIESSLRDLARENTLLPVRLKRIDGKMIDADVGFFSLDGGDAEQVMIEARDITAHNRAVAALRSSIDTLEHRVEERTRALRDEIAERRRTEERYRQLATHDMLTNLPNRTLLPEKVDDALKQAKRNRLGVAVLFVDLDGFKAINDTYGHDAGDQVLVEVAHRLRGCLRETDTAARMGGDEFVVVLDQLESPDNAVKVAQKILASLSAPFDLDTNKGAIGASIGIALYPEHGRNYDALLTSADNAMYGVKGSGKNGYSFPNTSR
ncbi:diguanylate cyclase domain-containing protein [Varunaivibrio sulfuroxidans]